MKTKRALTRIIVAIFSTMVLLPGVSLSQGRIAGRKIVSSIRNGRAAEYVGGEIAVRLKGGTSASSLTPILNEFHATIEDSFHQLGWGWISMPDTSNIMPAISALEEISGVQTAEPNFVTHVDALPNDPYFNGTSLQHIPINGR